MMQAENYLHVGYQKILTFERPGGGFDWWGNGPALVWLTAYGVQQLSALARVKEIDRNVIERARQFLASQQKQDGSWNLSEQTHGETISHVARPQFALTAYVVWSLCDADLRDEAVLRGCNYLRAHLREADGNIYLMALAANALISYNTQDADGVRLLADIDRLKREQDGVVYWQMDGKTATCAYGNSGNNEVTALIVLAMDKARRHIDVANKAISYLVRQRGSAGTWGSTQATILALRCLVAAEAMRFTGGTAEIAISLNGQSGGNWRLDDSNREVVQLCDLGPWTRGGDNLLRLEVKGEPNVMYQVVTRYYMPWRKPVVVAPVIDLQVKYDRTVLAKNDIITADASLFYRGVEPTFMVIVDLGIPPGFSADAGDFAELMTGGVVKRYSLTANQATLYLGDVQPGQRVSWRYHLKAKYPLKAKTPESTAYEYYSPQTRSSVQPVELEVKE